VTLVLLLLLLLLVTVMYLCHCDCGVERPQQRLYGAKRPLHQRDTCKRLTYDV
jgi:hypothetical protein